ncbi:hypothetical protein, partial [Raoultella ornithinolytica]|uniref:hypothetical protein n=1 Tax=Raoultella ornithinolytica TaxID=54291 RepID=UPI00403E1FE9
MHTHLAGNHCLAQAMVMKAGDLVSLSFGQLMVSHGVPLCFFGEKKRTRTGSWPLLSYAPWVLQLLSEFASTSSLLMSADTVFAFSAERGEGIRQ